jgi:hypothetical protein
MPDCEHGCERRASAYRATVFRTGGPPGKTRDAVGTGIDRCLHSLTRWRTFMKKSILMVFLLLAAALAGCSHPNDLIEDVASAATSNAQA